MSTYIKKGYGFSVGQDFARAWNDLPITIDPDAYTKPGFVVGTITGNMGSALGFLRHTSIRVHVTKLGIIDKG